MNKMDLEHRINSREVEHELEVRPVFEFSVEKNPELEEKICKTPFISRNLNSSQVESDGIFPPRNPDVSKQFTGEFVAGHFFYYDNWLKNTIKDPKFELWKNEGIARYNNRKISLPSTFIPDRPCMVGGADNQWLSSNKYDYGSDCYVNVYFNRINENFKKYLEYIQESFQPYFYPKKIDQIVDAHANFFNKHIKQINFNTDYEASKVKADFNPDCFREYAQRELELLELIIQQLLKGRTGEPIMLLKNSVFGGEDGVNFFHRTTLPIFVHGNFIESNEEMKEVVNSGKFRSTVETDMFKEFNDPNVPSYKWRDLCSYYEIIFPGVDGLDNRAIVSTEQNLNSLNRLIDANSAVLSIEQAKQQREREQELLHKNLNWLAKIDRFLEYIRHNKESLLSMKRFWEYQKHKDAAGFVRKSLPALLNIGRYHIGSYHSLPHLMATPFCDIDRLKTRGWVNDIQIKLLSTKELTEDEAMNLISEDEIIKSFESCLVNKYTR